MNQSAWRAAGDQVGGGGFWSIVAVVGPALCAALLLFLIIRAVVRHGRYRVVGTFGEEDRRAVVEAVVEAERKTVGEILPVIVERSDPHPGAAWMAALCFVVVGSTLLVTWLPWQRPLLLLLAQLSMGALGFGLTKWLPDFKRVFVFEDRATEVAGEQAFQEFYANELHNTEAATGVLMFVSLFERRVIVLADKGIDSKVDADFWADTDNLVLDGIRNGSLRDGLVAGIRRSGELLVENFPWKEGDRNEIPDRVIVRRE
jgi:putative membrane protein